MIKLFRRLRQKLLIEGNLKNYLLYALGEIILVVIGILIAISLNDSNQNKNAEVDLSQKIKKIREEIYSDSLRFEIIIKFNNQRIESIERMIGMIEDDISINDYHHLIKYLGEESGKTKTFSPNSQTYMGLINSGEFSKIQNELLKDRISFLYFYYDHMSKFNYTTIANIQSFNQELYSNGILSARYINEDRVNKLHEEGYQYLQMILSNPNQKIIFENYLYIDKKLCESVIKRTQQIFSNMKGLPLKPVGQ